MLSFFYIGVYFNLLSTLYSLLYSSWLPLGFSFAVFICRSLSQQWSFFFYRAFAGGLTECLWIYSPCIMVVIAHSPPFDYCVWFGGCAQVKLEFLLAQCYEVQLCPRNILIFFVCMYKFRDNWCQSFGTLCGALITVILLKYCCFFSPSFLKHTHIHASTNYSFLFQSSRGEKSTIMCDTRVQNSGSQLSSHFHSVHMWQLGSLSYVRLNLCWGDNLSHILPCICT